MIANTTELMVATRNLGMMENALHALQNQLEVNNPNLLHVTSKAYLTRIAALQSEIANYLYQHPTEVSLILPHAEAETFVS